MADGDSVVRIATRYRMNGLGVEFQKGQNFPQPSRLALGLNRPVYSGYRYSGQIVASNTHPLLPSRLKEDVETSSTAFFSDCVLVFSTWWCSNKATETCKKVNKWTYSVQVLRLSWHKSISTHNVQEVILLPPVFGHHGAHLVSIKEGEFQAPFSKMPYAMKVFNTTYCHFFAGRTCLITRVRALVVTNRSMITHGRRYFFPFSKAISPVLEPIQTLNEWVGALQT